MTRKAQIKPWLSIWPVLITAKTYKAMKKILVKNSRPWLLIISLLMLASTSCKKYLDAKSDGSLVIPKTIQDLQALLDNTTVFNFNGSNWDEASADNYYLPDIQYQIYAPSVYGKLYTWQVKGEDIQGPPDDWSLSYDAINYANIVLKAIDKVAPNAGNLTAWNNVKGSALVFRSYYYLRLAFTFCNAYDENTATTDLGLPLRLNPDFNIPSVRSNLKATYDRIIEDLETAVPLLPNVPVHVMRPSKPAAYGLLARTFLAMRKYDKAFQNADLSLQLKPDLIDFNDINYVDANNLFAPIKSFNPEVILNMDMFAPSSLYPTENRVDSILYDSYDNNDLRKDVFMLDAGLIGDVGYMFQGSYDAAFGNMFNGLANDEIYLTRAECHARLGRKDAALNDLNFLLQKRWKTGFFTPLSASSDLEALNLVLAERRKELIFRCLRWMDIKRLNKEGANIVLTRVADGITHSLQPNDKKYALPLPKAIIDITGMPQNPR